MGSKNTSFPKNNSRFQALGLDFSQPKIMGILNLTPDSFFDGGKYPDNKQILSHVERMISDGAHIIDIGAVSTRPGAENVDEKEEYRRMVSPIRALTKAFPTAIFSVDTYRSEIARAMIGEGVHMINDISGGQFDDKMFQTVAELKVPYILMHMKGEPENMQDKPISRAAVEQLQLFFTEKIKMLNDLGVNDIILDPGFGFGKSLDCNYSILKNLEKLRIQDLPLLVGVSRKSMINKVLDTSPDEALNGSTVLHTIALLNGANILRAHDVAEAKEVVRVVGHYTTFTDCDQ